MHFELSEEQKIIQNTAKKFAEKEILPILEGITGIANRFRSWKGLRTFKS